MSGAGESAAVRPLPAASASARPLACLANLPPELKSLIVLKAVEVDLEDLDDDDDLDVEPWVDQDDSLDSGAFPGDANVGSSKRKRQRSDVGRSRPQDGDHHSHKGEEDDDGWRDVDEEDDDEEHHSSHAQDSGDLQYLRDLGDTLKWTALGALSLVNREFNEIATPYLWAVRSKTRDSGGGQFSAS